MAQNDPLIQLINTMPQMLYKMLQQRSVTSRYEKQEEARREREATAFQRRSKESLLDEVRRLNSTLSSVGKDTVNIPNDANKEELNRLYNKANQRLQEAGRESRKTEEFKLFRDYYQDRRTPKVERMEELRYMHGDEPVENWDDASKEKYKTLSKELDDIDSKYKEHVSQKATETPWEVFYPEDEEDETAGGDRGFTFDDLQQYASDEELALLNKAPENVRLKIANELTRRKQSGQQAKGLYGELTKENWRVSPGEIERREGRTAYPRDMYLLQQYLENAGVPITGKLRPEQEQFSEPREYLQEYLEQTPEWQRVKGTREIVGELNRLVNPIEATRGLLQQTLQRQEPDSPLSRLNRYFRSIEGKIGKNFVDPFSQ